MNYKLEKENNSKKIIILISVICCSLILVIGITTAYFTASKSNNIDNIVAVNNIGLEYNDSTTYMRQGLIPATESIAKQAYQRTEEGKKCLDSGNYSACSIYEFSVKNTANVSQDLIIDMIPTVNTFTNLYFMLYEIDSEGNSSELITSQQISKLTEEIIQSNNIPTYNLREKITIKPNKTKTYQIVFFINNTGVDQTLEDAGKKFGASIKITSIATGKYIIKTFGESCWQTELLSDGTYKLTEFYGINNDSSDTENYGNINESCTGYVSKDENDGFYSINIPSEVGAKQISTLGNELFLAVDINTFTINNYTKVKKITISEGITTIEDGIISGNLVYGAFTSVGCNGLTQEMVVDELSIKFPNTLKYIGQSSFVSSGLKQLTLPSSLTDIGQFAFINSPHLKKVILTDSSDENIKLTIGEYVFNNTGLEELSISNNVTTIGDNAFSSTQLSSIVIPSSVETIGSGAFSSNSNLITVTFVGAEDGTSSLTTIGGSAFDSCNLTYTEETNPLILPSSNITFIGSSAFSNNNNLNYIKFTGATTGFGEHWNGNATIIS